MLFAYRRALTATVADVERLFADGRPFLDCLDPLLPAEPSGIRGWKVWLAFWGKALVDEAFRHEQEQRSREALALVARLAARELTGGDVAAAGPVARQLLVTVVGLATQAIYDPENWPPAEQRRVLADQVAAIRLAAGG